MGKRKKMPISSKWPSIEQNRKLASISVWKSASISETAAHKVKISSISTLWDRKTVYVLLLELWPIDKFHVQIRQFLKIGPYLRNCCPYSENQLNFDLLGRKRLYIQIFNFCQWPSFHAQIWQFWKSARISEMAACRAKINSISNP